MSRQPTARCTRCRRRKPLTAFYLRRSGRPLGYCKDCQRRAVRAAEQQRRHRSLPTPGPGGGDAA